MASFCAEVRTEVMAEFIYGYICVHKVDKVFLSQCGTLFLTSKTSKVRKFNCQFVDQYFDLDFPPLRTVCSFSAALASVFLALGFCGGVLSGFFGSGSGSEIVILLSWILIQVRQLNKLGIKGN
jgi:hypothetical protein